jgi:hypothetical protein
MPPDTDFTLGTEHGTNEPESEEAKTELLIPLAPKKTKTKDKFRTRLDVLHCDIIGYEFWQTRPGLLLD